MLKPFRFATLSIAALALPHLAHAHAVLVQSTPALNSTVHGTALHIALRFNSRIDGPHCTLSLASPSGSDRPLTLGKQAAPDSISAEADHLQPGAYSIHWQSLASDGHITRGSIPFRVE